jgi:hypothetical protein
MQQSRFLVSELITDTDVEAVAQLVHLEALNVGL